MLRNFAAAILLFVTATGCGAAEPASGPARSAALANASLVIDEAIARARARSNHFAHRGQLLPTDFDPPFFSWDQPTRSSSPNSHQVLLKPSNQPSPMAQSVRALVTFGACKHSPLAIRKVHALDRLIAFGIFSAPERRYLQHVSDRLALGLAFDVQPGPVPKDPSHAIRSHNDRVGLNAALNAGDLRRATAYAGRFHWLCGRNEPPTFGAR